MLFIARALAVLSVLFTIVAIEIIGVQYLPIGFGATGLFGGVFLLLATVTALSVLVIVRWRLGRSGGLALVAVSCSTCLVALALLLAEVW